MEAILALQRQLAAVQEQTQTARLSDRNIVEIIDALTKNYDFKLIYTLDGREYLTSDHLEKQIKEVVQDYGRINIVELPKVLNIGIERIEPRVDALCKKGGEIVNKTGQLFTNKYIDDICEEINEELQQRHKVAISDISLKFGLPHEFMVKSMTMRLGTIIQGQIQNNFLITMSYQNTIKAQLRGVLRACIRPTTISQIKKLYGIDEPTINSVIEELIANQEIDGVLRQGAFITARFLENQEKIITKFYKQNSYIEYEFLSKNLYVQKPKEMLKDLFKNDCIFLENCCYSKESLEHTKEQIVETLNTEGAIDVANLFPSVLDEEEIEALITEHLGLQDIELSKSLVISTAYLEKCTQAFKDKIVENIYKAPQKLIEKPAEEEESKKGKGKGKGGKKKAESDANDLFSKDEIIKHLRDTKLLSADYDPELEEMLCKHLKERLQKLYNVIKVELFENKKNMSSELVNEIQARLEERISAVAFITKYIQNIETKNTAVDINYLRNKAAVFMKPIVENMIFLYCRKYSLQVNPSLLSSEEKKEGEDSKRLRFEEPPMFKNYEGMVSTLDILPKDLSKLMKAFNDLIVQKKVYEASELLQKHALDLSIKPISLDKKNEKNFIYSQRYFTKEDLHGAKYDPKLQFYYVLTLLGLEQNIYLGLEFEEKAVSTYCSILLGEENVNDEVKKEIQKAMELYNETSESKVKELEEQVKKLKSHISK